MADEDGLAAPFDDYLRWSAFLVAQTIGIGFAYILALRDGLQANLDLGLCQHISRGGHIHQEVCPQSVFFLAMSIT